MTTTRKAVIGTGIVLLVGLLAVLAVGEDRGSVVEVRVEEVRPRDLVARVSATGHIEPKRAVDISADISGRVVRLPVEEGEDVREGDLLLVIDPTQYEAAVQQARASLSEARAREAQARAAFVQTDRDAQRLEALRERTQGLVTDQEVELARTEAETRRALLDAAEHGVEQAEAALEQARDRLEKTIIRAPMSGRVTRLNVERGETAVVGTIGTPGTLLMTISDLSVMEAVIEVDETDIPEIAHGDSAVVEIDAFPNRRFSGRVTKIGNSSIRPRESRAMTGASGSEQAIDFEVRVTLDDPPDGVRPDLSATADVVTAVRPAALAIPITALTLVEAETLEEVPSEVLPEGARPRPRREIEGVYVIEEGLARFRPVRIGIAGEGHFEVLDGLDEGERVVSGTYQAIRELEDGSRVRVTAADTVGGRTETAGSEADAGES